MTAYTPTPKTQVRRRATRGVYDRAVVHRILDEALVAHIGFTIDGEPHVLPTAFARIGEAVYVHGSTSNHMLTSLENGAPACITVTLIDSIVAGRSGFGCSMDYRSVVIFARAEKVEDPAEKERLIEAFVQHIIPGHRVRSPKRAEIAATVFLRFPLDEVSAKVRDVGVVDVEDDYELDLWAGVIPLRIDAEPGIGCPRLKPGTAVPAYARRYRR
jgi:nitroimidazol reductase NimA-like FMN-containing flavoprotein (pyridoxamine 5'-phosphate oxidase superfamily)